MTNIKTTLDDLLKQAIKDNDVKTKNFIRQLRAKVFDYCLSKGLRRDSSDDPTWTKVILIYQRSIAKALDMLRRRGVGESELAKTYEFEVEFCDKFLPKQKTADEIRTLVASKVQELGPVAVGKLIGAIMKDADPGTVDPGLVKKFAAELVG